jgi:large subunit ribosomal protein L24
VKVKLQKGDTVEVISGPRDERGFRGEVIKVLPKGRRIVIQGVNVHKKHQQQVQSQGRTMKPGIIEFEAPMDISNVMLVCPNCNERTRVRVERDEDNLPHRVCKSCDQRVD